MKGFSMKRFLIAPICLLIFALSQTSAAAPKKSPTPPDKAYMQKIWTGWATLDTANVAQFYATGPHTFFDVAPLKYNSWDEYQAGVKAVIGDYKSAKFTVNDDAAIHAEGDWAWGTATVGYEVTTKADKVQMGNFRWTVIWQNENGKWLTVHEHVSVPNQ
jgi:ketosteroid isomerase-like protein